jgi:hypothetical protein
VPDPNAFIDAIGKDVSAAVAPRLEELGRDLEARISHFATAVIQDLFQRYQPELSGELRTKLVRGGLEVVGQGVRLDLKHRDTGAVVASLDVPVALTVKVDAVSVNLAETTIGLDVVR